MQTLIGLFLVAAPLLLGIVTGEVSLEARLAAVALALPLLAAGLVGGRPAALSPSSRALMDRALAIAMFATAAVFTARAESLVTLLIVAAGLVHAAVLLLACDRSAQAGEAGSRARSRGRRVGRPQPLTAERARAYGRLVRMLSSLEAEGLPRSQRERIRRAADELVFCSDLAADPSAREALKDVAARADGLRTAGRLSGKAAVRLLADLAACGPSPPQNRPARLRGVRPHPKGSSFAHEARAG